MYIRERNIVKFKMFPHTVRLSTQEHEYSLNKDNLKGLYSAFMLFATNGISINLSINDFLLSDLEDHEYSPTSRYLLPDVYDTINAPLYFYKKILPHDIERDNFPKIIELPIMSPITERYIILSECPKYGITIVTDNEADFINGMILASSIVNRYYDYRLINSVKGYIDINDYNVLTGFQWNNLPSELQDIIIEYNPASFLGVTKSYDTKAKELLINQHYIKNSIYNTIHALAEYRSPRTKHLIVRYIDRIIETHNIRFIKRTICSSDYIRILYDVELIQYHYNKIKELYSNKELSSIVLVNPNYVQLAINEGVFRMNRPYEIIRDRIDDDNFHRNNYLHSAIVLMDNCINIDPSIGYILPLLTEDLGWRYYHKVIVCLNANDLDVLHDNLMFNMCTMRNKNIGLGSMLINYVSDIDASTLIYHILTNMVDCSISCDEATMPQVKYWFYIIGSSPRVTKEWVEEGRKLLLNPKLPLKLVEWMEAGFNDNPNMK